MKLSQEEEKAIEWFKEDLTKEKEEMEYYNEYKKQVIKRNEKLLNLIENQQKEIEEREIRLQEEIDTWKETENDYEHELARKDEEIENQQKEIEELKKPKYLVHFENNKITKMELTNDYISKDKIREKIKEIMGYTFTLVEERHCQDYACDRLKELLEE